MIASGEADHGTVVLAENQTKGKGQRGNSWESESGLNLTASFILKPKGLKAENQFLLSAVSALAIQQMVRKVLGAKVGPIKIKWPNDILVDRKKIAGILIENSLQGDEISHSVIGIGVNVNQTEFEGLPHATSLSVNSPTEYEIDELLNNLGKNLTAFYSLIETDSQLLMELFREHLFGLHSWLNLAVNGVEGEHRILGIENDGRLKIEDRSFKLQSVQHHEVQWLQFS